MLRPSPSRRVILFCLAFSAAASLASRVAAQERTAREEAASQRLFSQGERKEKAGDLEGALVEYRLLVQQFPMSELVDSSLLRVARGEWQLGQAGDATRTAQDLIANHARTRSAAGAFVLLGEIAIARAKSSGDLEKARASLQRVPLLFASDSYPELESRTVARVLSARLSYRLGALDQAAAELVAALEDEPQSPWSGPARLELGLVLLANGDWRAAAETLQRAVEPSGDPATAAAARNLLTLLHRLYVRPAAGQSPWLSARLLRPGGVELKRPVAVAVGPTGQIALVDDRQGLLLLDDGGRIQLRSEPADAGRPWFDRSGNLLLVTEARVVEIFSGQSWSFSVLEAGGKGPQPLERLRLGINGAFGDWFLVDEKVDGLLRFGPDRGFRGTVRQFPEAPADLALDPRGRLYALDARANRVVRFNLDTDLESTVAAGNWKQAVAISFDELGNLYVLDAGNQRVEVFGPDGQRRTTIGPDLPGGLRLERPEDIAVDATGRLLIPDRRHGALVVVE